MAILQTITIETKYIFVQRTQNEKTEVTSKTQSAAVTSIFKTQETQEIFCNLYERTERGDNVANTVITVDAL